VEFSASSRCDDFFLCARFSIRAPAGVRLSRPGETIGDRSSGEAARALPEARRDRSNAAASRFTDSAKLFQALGGRSSGQ